MSAEAARKLEIFTRAMGYMAQAIPQIVSEGSSNSGTFQPSATTQLYGPSGQIIPDSQYAYRREAAKRTGSMHNWIPKRVTDRSQEALEREQIVERSIDLVQNDAHAAGLVDNFAATVIGSGLMPIPEPPADTLGLDKDEVSALQTQQRAIYQKWYPFADASGRMNFGAIQYLCNRALIEYGEYLCLLPMIDDPHRPYSLACHLINPLRLRTPADKFGDSRIKDGVELGDRGEPVAYWIKKSSPVGVRVALPDTSINFLRIPRKRGHRLNVIHYFKQDEPEQVRGVPYLSPVLKTFRDYHDLLDAELVSNYITASISLAIEMTGNNDPLNLAQSMANLTKAKGNNNDAGADKDIRYQDFHPGQLMFLGDGLKANPIVANRPGITFDPFTKIIRKAMAFGVGLPYPVAFMDVEDVNFAGFRSAMLQAWRVFTMHRQWQADNFNSPIWTMLMEEAYLRGDLSIKHFYSNMAEYTNCEWRGSPKGDIEPLKAIQSDIMAIQNNLASREQVITDRGGDLRTTFSQIANEQQIMKELGLTEEPVTSGSVGDTKDDTGETDAE